MLSRLFFASLLFVCSHTASSSPLYIGIDADMSAVSKSGGIAIQRGAQLAIDEINEAGGVLGRPLELIIKDHRGNPARGIKNLKKLSKNPDLLAVLGGVHTPVILKELKLIHENKILYLVPWAAGTPIISNSFDPNFVFRASIRDAEAGGVLVKYAKSRKATKIGLLLENTGWGRSNEKSMSAAASKHKLEVASTQWFNWGITSVDKQIAALEEANVGAILMVSNAPEGAVLIKAILQSEKLKNIPIISHWGIASGAFVKLLGLDNLNKADISTIQTFSFDKPTNKKVSNKVLSAYQNKYNSEASTINIPGAVGVAHAYDLVHMLALAVKSSGSADSNANRKALENIPKYNGLVKNYTPPFTPQQHDALLADDYFVATFDKNGNIIPR